TVFEDGVGSMYRPSSDRDSASMGSAELGTGMRESPSLDSGIHSDINYRQRSSCHQQQVLQAKVEELIVQRKLNQYTHLTFGEEEMDMNDRTSPLASFIGSSSQVLFIACKNKRQQYRLTPGDERITIGIVDCLADSMEKDGMLCLYHSREDNKPAHFLSLSEGQCVGCKRDFNNDRNNVVKIILQDGTHWSLALETEPEANNWLQCLCQAVSEGLKMKCSRASCIPCCMVVSKFKLLVCHEDLETNFMRTLGSANLHDVSALLTDEFNKSYIVLVFQSDEGKMDNDKWVVYFNCEHECERFTKALSDCWYTHYQVAVPELPVDDFSLQKKCSDMAQHLRQTHPIP
ncbi:PKHM2-like protein, partial [Mya arenaria]